MSCKFALNSLLFGSAVCATLCLAGCSSSDSSKAADAEAEAAPSSSANFFKTIDSKLDKSRVKSDEGDMYKFKNDEMVIFHKERRSDGLLEKNESLDPSYYK